ncbi:MAG: lycopene cyclase [Lewinellaceae bacterium]|nr:lycopene cyclase [Lewinellaceae bacterium]
MEEQNDNSTLQPEHYDIIFAGTGLSGLTLAVELARRPAFQDKKILLLDRDRKQQNDRTWCFWATDAEPLPPVVFRSWDRCRFFSTGFETSMDIAPYRYRMVRGIDFYNWANAELRKNPNIHRVHATISDLNPSRGLVRTDAGEFTADLVFNSAFTKTRVLPEAGGAYPGPPFSILPDNRGATRSTSIFLLQHFKGWIIETPAPAFDPGSVTFMDFRIEQHGETRFVYVLPFSENRALVEFTVFSPAMLPPETYDQELRRYLSAFLKINDFEIKEEEFGVIPMTDFPFPARQEGKVIHIGTAGGFVKASSGYAFKRTQRKVRAFVDAWERTGRPDARTFQSPRIFRLFDSIFLRVLRDRNELGHVIFSNLFQKLPPTLVLRFLDEDSTPLENLRLVAAPPARPFLRAFFQLLFAK